MSKRIFLSLLLLLSVAVGVADELARGELAYTINGSPAKTGQATNDHLFVRNTYGDTGAEAVYDNVISFKSGDVQTIWFWLDDDEIYMNEAVQALPKSLVANNAEEYGEITYNTFQCNLYLPADYLEMIEVENEEGDVVAHEQGARMPNTAVFDYLKHDTKVIDGITYQVYKIVITNQQVNGTHFSAINARAYRDNGPLKKDDAPLFGLFIKKKNQQMQGRQPDMIIANLDFGFRESVMAGLDANHSRFFYGEGGNEETQRFQFYHRVAVYGSIGNARGDVNGDGVVTINDVTDLIDNLLQGMTIADTPSSDVNQDGAVTINDVTELIEYLLTNEWPNA